MLLVLTLAALVQAAVIAGPADSREFMVPLDGAGTIGPRIAQVCAAAKQQRPGSFVQVEIAASERLERRPKIADWNRVATYLACVRAAAFADGVKAQAGYLMPLGTDLATGAIRLADSVLASEPANLVAARLLAVLGVAVTKVDSNAVIPGKMTQARRGVPAGPIADLLYRSVRAGVSDSLVYRGCVSLFLDAGDYATARDCSRRALAAGADSSWHLVRLAYLAFHGADTLAGVKLFDDAVALARDRASRAELGWHLNLRTGTWRPRTSLTVASPMTQADADEWLSLNDSARRVDWVRDRLAMMHRVSGHSVGAMLGTHFFSITYAMAAFWGCTQSGGYLKSSLTGPGMKTFTDYQPGFVPPVPPCFPTLAPDLHPIPVSASRYRLWRPESGAPVTLVSYAVSPGSLIFLDDSVGATTRLEFDVRERDAALNHWFDTTIVRQYCLPSDHHDGSLQGLVVLARGEAASDWTFGVVQSENRRGIVDYEKAPLDAGPLALSDVVIGDPNQHFSWAESGDSVVLAPLGTVDRHALLKLFVQLKAAGAQPQLRNTISIYRVKDGQRNAKPTLQIASTISAPAGLSAIRRGLDFSRLGSGVYDVQVRVTNNHDTAVATTRMVVKG